MFREQVVSYEGWQQIMVEEAERWLCQAIVCLSVMRKIWILYSKGNGESL